ncbi:MAG: bleomycin resistance protein [Altibacter sp.]|uniref:VOC family protein n=1 Tax=Altibacter sp. TaxID=2024823 RepID=UPI001DEE2C22|nr:VOC family protein [Altibacter sp.]MBZ0326750.1 bleomycin resistance protein [Altibacter sp.]
MENRFHISLPCLSTKATKDYYCDIIGAQMGRRAEKWVDINLFNHQITFIKSGKFKFDYANYGFENTVLPSFHFGVILENAEWKKLYQKLKAHVHIDITHFLKGSNGEHESFFIKDPNGYVIEFKCFKDGDTIFKA